MGNSQDNQVSSMDMVENAHPLVGPYAPNPCEALRMPRGETCFIRDFILCSTVQCLQKYGEGMLEEHREFLLTSLEYLASFT